MPKQLPRLNGHNHLISTLSPEDQALLKPHLTEVVLDHDMVLEERNRPVERVIFPISGITSIIAFSVVKERRIEAGLFGHDGMSGISILLGAETASNDLVVQVSGHGLQINTERLRELLEQSSSLQQHLLRFIHTLLTQTAQTALSNKHNSLEERLARWLLMCHDRVNGDRLNLTHEFMSIMLGTRRSGVTVGTQTLEGRGVIRARRGEITVLEREGLEEEAGGSYGVPEAEYLKLFGSSIRT
jgi:CRP-like cAMP-binding protein